MDRRDHGLLVISVLVGPLVGLVAVLLVFGFVGVFFGNSAFVGNDPFAFIGALPLLLPFAYLLGLVPALVGAIALIVLSRWFRKHRLLLAAPVGAICAMPLPLLLFGRSPSLSDWGPVLIMLFSGAISAMSCVALADRGGR